MMEPENQVADRSPKVHKEQTYSIVTAIPQNLGLNLEICPPHVIQKLQE